MDDHPGRRRGFPRDRRRAEPPGRVAAAAKFVIKDVAGNIVQQATSPTFTRTGNLGSCELTAADDVVPVVTPDGIPEYKWDGSQYHYNWSTKGLTSGEYRIYANLADGTARYVDICLTK